MSDTWAKVAAIAAALLLSIAGDAAAQPPVAASAGAPAGSWWEAERPRASNFPAGNPFAPRDAKEASALSDGKWIGANDPGKTLFLEYDVAVAAAGEQELYVRKFWSHGPFRWRFDGQPWRTCGRDVALLDAVELRQFVGVNWVRLGEVTLGRGNHVLRIELLENQGPSAFDAFLLTAAPFTPRGKLKPGQKVGVAPEGWFPFEPDLDPFEASPLDLRRLNETRAGDGGFIEARGDGFVHASSGRPVRFWAIDVGAQALRHGRRGLERMARFLAKFGVNLVRFHGPLWRDDDVTRIDDGKLERVHALAAALAHEGIYLELSIYFPLWLKPKGGPGFEGYDGQQHPFALQYFSRSFQQLQKSWWRAVLTPKNPYTGLPLGRDPALAFIEIVNEDSAFFWTFAPRSIPAAQMQVVERLFGDWLRKKDGTLARTFDRWGGGRVQGDDEAGGRAGFLPLSDVTQRRDARARDTATFLADLQRTYYDDMYRYLKRDLAFRGSVTGSNWVTADARRLGPLDKWSNAGCDFMDRHGYFGGPHEGNRATFAISGGDRYDDALALRFETGRPGEQSFDLPIMDLAYDGKPSTISEVGWLPPNRYRTDMPLLAAAYGALQGTDAFVFFAGGENTWSQQLEKFTIGDPATLGQFPAAALIYRQGLVKTARAVVHLEVPLARLRALEGVPIAAPQNLDALRAEGFLKRLRRAVTTDDAKVDPLAFLAGRVEVKITEAPGGASRIDDLSALIDRRAQTVRSETGELSWSWGRGLATIDAPAAQGVTGLLRAAGPIRLRDVTIASENEYGAVVLVALDGAPLATSRRMLLQVMSEDANTGWSAPGQGLRTIASVGGPPLVVRKLAGRVTFRRPDAASLTVSPLDFNGYRGGSPVAVTAAGELALSPTTFHYLIEKAGPGVKP